MSAIGEAAKVFCYNFLKKKKKKTGGSNIYSFMGIAQQVINVC